MRVIVPLIFLALFGCGQEIKSLSQKKGPIEGEKRFRFAMNQFLDDAARVAAQFSDKEASRYVGVTFQSAKDRFGDIPQEPDDEKFFGMKNDARQIIGTLGHIKAFNDLRGQALSQETYKEITESGNLACSTAKEQIKSLTKRLEE